MTECLTRLPKAVQQLHIRAQLSVYLQRRTRVTADSTSVAVSPHPTPQLFAFYYLSFVDTCIFIMAKYQNKSQSHNKFSEMRGILFWKGDVSVSNIKVLLICVLLSGLNDGGAEPLHQDEPSSGIAAAVDGRCPGHRLPAADDHGHARSGGLVPLSTTRERPPCAQRHLHTRPEHQLHWLLPLRYDIRASVLFVWLLLFMFRVAHSSIQSSWW